MEYIQYEFSDTNKIHSIEKNSDSNRKKVPEYGIAPSNGTVSNKHFYWDTDFRYSIGDLSPIFLLAFLHQFRKPFAPTF